jgi:hypothetical protein
MQREIKEIAGDKDHPTATTPAAGHAHAPFYIYKYIGAYGHIEIMHSTGH